MTHLQHAHAYAQRGWRLAPQAPGTKRPGLTDWANQARNDPAWVQHWWGSPDPPGICVVTGPGSGLLVIDIDPDHGGDDSLHDLEQIHGPLPATYEVLTGGGGRHLYFTHPQLAPGTTIGNSAGRLGPGIDIRATGGQVVAPPSIHPDTGRPYEREISSPEHTAPLPPAWVELLTEPATVIPPGQIDASGRWDTRFAWDHHNAGGNAAALELLTAAGWHTPATDRTGAIYLTRPGKPPGAGHGCSVGKVAPGVTYCFTSSAPPLEAERGYTPAELYTQLRHGGDRVAADRALVEATGLLPTYAQDPNWLQQWAAVAPAGPGPHPIDWPAFWARERRVDDWAIPPVVPAGRLVTIWAARKTGKSLFALDVAAAAATGRPIIGGDGQDPIGVVYLDMEMTEDDLEERLSDLGYGPTDDLSLLHYYLLPTLPPLDTDAGGAALAAIVGRHRPQVVVIDTLARVVDGEENSADTYRAFYRCTGMRLKQLGVACLRLDHAGKQKDKGERGSSAKGDDVDLSWELKETGAGQYQLKRSYTRIPWAKEIITLRREEEPLRHVAAMGGWSPGVAPLAVAMDELGLPVDVTVDAAARALRKAGKGKRRDVVSEAVRFRRTARPLAGAVDNPVDNSGFNLGNGRGTEK